MSGGGGNCLHCIFKFPLQPSSRPLIYCSPKPRHGVEYYDLLAGMSAFSPDWDDSIMQGLVSVLTCFERRHTEAVTYRGKSALVAGLVLNNQLRDVLVGGNFVTGRSIGPWPIREASMASGYSDHSWWDAVSDMCLRSENFGDEQSVSSWERWTLYGIADSWYSGDSASCTLSLEEEYAGACFYIKYPDLGRIDSICAGWVSAELERITFFQWALRTSNSICTGFCNGSLTLCRGTHQFRVIATVSGDWVHFSEQYIRAHGRAASWDEIHTKYIGFSPGVQRS
jgi:hypothetical protein